MGKNSPSRITHLSDGVTMPESFDEQGDLIWIHIGNILRSTGMDNGEPCFSAHLHRRPKIRRSERVAEGQIPGTPSARVDGCLLPVARPKVEARDRRNGLQVRLARGTRIVKVFVGAREFAQGPANWDPPRGGTKRSSKTIRLRNVTATAWFLRSERCETALR